MAQSRMFLRLAAEIPLDTMRDLVRCAQVDQSLVTGVSLLHIVGDPRGIELALAIMPAGCRTGTSMSQRTGFNLRSTSLGTVATAIARLVTKL